MESQILKDIQSIKLWNRKVKFLDKNIHSVLESKTVEQWGVMSAWKWISEVYLRNNSEGMLMASQSQAIRNVFMKVNINKVIILLLCRMCREMRLSAILYINAMRRRNWSMLKMLSLFLRSYEESMVLNAVTNIMSMWWQIWRELCTIKNWNPGKYYD